MIRRYAHHYPESLRAGIEVLDRVNGTVAQKVTQSNEKGVTKTSQPLEIIGSGAWI